MKKTTYQIILELIRDNDKSTTAQIRDMSGVAKGTAKGSLSRLINNGLIVISGFNKIGKIDQRLYSITDDGLEYLRENKDLRQSLNGGSEKKEASKYGIQDHEKQLKSIISSARQHGRFGILINQAM